MFIRVSPLGFAEPGRDICGSGSDTGQLGSGSSTYGKLKTFPVSTLVDGRRVVVVGGGDAAGGKLRLLGEDERGGRDLRRRAGGGRRGRSPRARAGTIVRRDRRTSRTSRARSLAFVGTDDEARDRRFARARARGRRSRSTSSTGRNSATCITPAIVDRAPLQVAISTEGDGPVLAGIIRNRIEDMLPQGLGSLVSLAGSLRERVAALLPPGRRRLKFWRDYFSDETLAARGRARRPTARAAGAAGSSTRHGPRRQGEGHVWLVGAGPGAADLLTMRARRVLSEADVIVFDSLVDEAVARGRPPRRPPHRRRQAQGPPLRRPGRDQRDPSRRGEGRQQRRAAEVRRPDDLWPRRRGDRRAARRPASPSPSCQESPPRSAPRPRRRSR